MDPVGPTVARKAAVCFHANFAVALDMAQHARWYASHGFGVLLVTMGGYPGSELAGPATELSTYDAAAAMMRICTCRC